MGDGLAAGFPLLSPSTVAQAFPQVAQKSLFLQSPAVSVSGKGPGLLGSWLSHVCEHAVIPLCWSVEDVSACFCVYFPCP